MRTREDYRQIYIDNYGDIPRGYHIHHKDGNSNNNDPSNLIALHPLKHAEEHRKRGEYWIASLIVGRYKRNKAHWRIYQKAFGYDYYLNRDYNPNTPLVKDESRMKSKDIYTLKKNNMIKPKSWGPLRYKNTLLAMNYSYGMLLKQDVDYSYIHDVISQLSDRQQEIIKLSFGFKGIKYTINEIAEDMSLSYDTIQKDRAKALEFIKLKISFKFL